MAKDRKYSEAAQLCTRVMAMVAVKPNWVSAIDDRVTVELHFINHDFRALHHSCLLLQGIPVSNAMLP